MADRGDTRRSRGRIRPTAIAVPVLVIAGLTLVVSGAGSGETPVRRPAAVIGAPSSAPVTEAVASPSPTPSLRRAVVEGPPQVVVVPALGVRSSIDPIRVAGGALTPPADPDRIGWWADGARPGALSGKAVLTGHTVQAGGGAFDDLETLAAGETVVVEATGGRVTYAVTSVRVLSREELARENESIFRLGGPHRLVLITCEDWDGVAYRSNVVVEATPRG